jgi:ribonuclease P protein component
LTGRAPAGAFPRTTRLTQPQDFKNVFDAKRKSSGALLLVFCNLNGGDAARLGMAIGKKTAAHAASRNYMRRVIRELFRRHKSELAGLDLVVCVRKAFTRGAWKDLVTEFSAHTQKLNRCRGAASS